MDELDRLFGLLVVALARETRVAVPFPASDVYERLVPYRSNRSRLNVATHQDYEMAVLRLLAGERSYVQLEPETVREAMQREIATINPDPAYFRTFPDAQVMVNGRAAERVLMADRAYAPPASTLDDELVDTTGENPVPVPFIPPPPPPRCGAIAARSAAPGRQIQGRARGESVRVLRRRVAGEPRGALLPALRATARGRTEVSGVRQ